MAAFKEKAHALINQGKRRERLELCRAYQKKYPNDETVLFELMHDLFSVDSIENSDEIISIANRLLNSNNTEYHFGAVQMLAFTHSKLGNYDASVKYARSVPLHRDILRSVLKGDELVEHCKWYFWKVCDKMYLYMKYLLDCTDAGYTHEEKHEMLETLYNMFHMIFSNQDFGYWHDRLARISFFMALESGKSGTFEKAICELEQMLAHLEKNQSFTDISHSSLLVNRIKIDQTNIVKSSTETLGHAYLRYLNNNDNVFASIKNDPRYTSIKERLAAL
jgi:hypothetical protein